MPARRSECRAFPEITRALERRPSPPGRPGITVFLPRPAPSPDPGKEVGAKALERPGAQQPRPTPPSLTTSSLALSLFLPAATPYEVAPGTQRTPSRPVTETCLDTASAKSDFSWLPSQGSQAQPASLTQSGKEDPSGAFRSRFCLSPLGSAAGSVQGGDWKPALPTVAGPATWARDLGPGAASSSLGGEAGRRAKPCGSALPGVWGPRVWFPSLLRPGCTRPWLFKMALCV